MREDIQNIIAQSLGLEVTDVEESKLLREDLGLDETELDQILKAIQEKHNIEFVAEDKDGIKTVGDLLDIAETYTPKA